jgi:hypothetical protein
VSLALTEIGPAHYFTPIGLNVEEQLRVCDVLVDVDKAEILNAVHNLISHALSNTPRGGEVKVTLRYLTDDEKEDVSQGRSRGKGGDFSLVNFVGAAARRVAHGIMGDAIASATATSANGFRSAAPGTGAGPLAQDNTMVAPPSGSSAFRRPSKSNGPGKRKSLTFSASTDGNSKLTLLENLSSLRRRSSASIEAFLQQARAAGRGGGGSKGDSGEGDQDDEQEPDTVVIEIIDEGEGFDEVRA